MFQLRDSLIEEYFLAMRHDAIACSCGDVVAHAASLIDDAVARKLLVAFHGGVGIHL